MAGGIASALASASRKGGRALTGDFGLFEVDEFWLGPVVEELEPRAMLLGNLYRDQLDRYGELETIADRWAAIVAAQVGRTTLVLNADDPLVADLGRVHEAPPSGAAGRRGRGAAVARRGDRARRGLLRRRRRLARAAELQHASDSKHCRRCGHAYAYSAVYLAHLGHYRCPNCGQERPRRTWSRPTSSCAASAAPRSRCAGAASSSRSPASTTSTTRSRAAALTLSLGVELDDVVEGLQAVAPAFGRAETLDLGGRPASLLLVKNPAGANEVLRTLALEQDELDLFGVLNDRIADGRDVSWVWDADWELLVGRVRRFTCYGTRAAELALRMKYAGLDADRIRVVDDLEKGLDAALADGDGPLYVVPTYTALLELRELLTKRGQVKAYWA